MNIIIKKKKKRTTKKKKKKKKKIRTSMNMGDIFESVFSFVKKLYKNKNFSSHPILFVCVCVYVCVCE